METAYAVAWKLGFRRGVSTAARRAIFTRIHETNEWGDTESVSGPGSTVARAAGLADALRDLFARYGISSVLDAPCGDFNWMRYVTPGAIPSYTGVDIVAKLIDRNNALHASATHRFLCADITSDALPVADLVVCRDALIHLSYADIDAALENFRRSGSTYLLTTTFDRLSRNEDTRTGGWRPLDLQSPPFSFPPPIETIADTPRGAVPWQKSLALWRLADVPRVRA